jgi:hypothetical protein
MRRCACLLVLAGLLAGADDLTTLDGKSYQGAEFEKSLPDGAVFKHRGREIGIAWTNLPPELAFRYRCEGGIVAARTGQRSVKITDGFRLNQLDAAKKKARAEGKPLGFVMVWDPFFNSPGDAAHGNGSIDAFVHFYTTFSDAMVLVFVRHEADIPAVPPAVTKGFNGPEGFAPNLIVVDPSAQTYICEIAGGAGSKGVAPAERERFFHAGIDKILAAKALWMRPAEAPLEKKK